MKRHQKEEEREKKAENREKRLQEHFFFILERFEIAFRAETKK